MLTAACLVTLAVHVDALTLWPQPQSQTWPEQAATLSLDGATFNFQATGFASNPLLDGFSRYLSIIFGLPPSRSSSTAVSSRQGAGPDITGADVNVTGASLDLTLETDQSYTLTVQAPRILINAPTVYGALYGMESLAQLVLRGTSINATTVVDSPRFAFRATMMDTSRHYYPVSVIKQHLDVMSFNKMNVLHWHVVDTVSFPYESVAFPSLAETGAYSPMHRYTQDDVADVISYAMNRGIRVLPEFDTPGHVGEGYASIPNLLTPCYSGQKPDGTTGPLNPTLNSTYDFLKTFYAEIKKVFPDKFVHVGGDEVSFDCWQSNPQITAWMQQHPTIKTYAQLEQYYELNLLEILKDQGTSYMCWEEIFDNGVQILPDTVVNVWKGGGWNVTLAKATAQGYHTVLSAPFYLNYISYGEDWPNYYSIEPTAFTGTDDQKKLVSGVEACMWSEFVDATNFIPRMWPRASAVAERGWSAKSVTDVNAARIRLAEFRCKMMARGVPAEPIVNGGAQTAGYRSENGAQSFCDVPFHFSYSPPWN